MANKSGSRHNKRIALPKTRHLSRKIHTWAIRPLPGPHSKLTVLPLGEILREKLGRAQNRKEANIILKSKKLLVDGKVRTSTKFPVGLFDVVSLPEEKKQFRCVFDRKGRLQLVMIPDAEKNTKVCKVTTKKSTGKDTVQLTTEDGRTFSQKSGAASVGDSLVLDLSDAGKIKSVLKLEKGHLAYVSSGVHVGTVAQIKDLTAGTMQKPALATLASDTEEFQTIAKNLVIIGKEKALLSVKAGEDEDQKEK